MAGLYMKSAPGDTRGMDPRDVFDKLKNMAYDGAVDLKAKENTEVRKFMRKWGLKELENTRYNPDNSAKTAKRSALKKAEFF